MNKDKKLLNWQQLNQKVLCKFNGLQLTQRQIIEVVECQQGAIEKILQQVKYNLEDWLKKKPTPAGKN